MCSIVAGERVIGIAVMKRELSTSRKSSIGNTMQDGIVCWVGPLRLMYILSTDATSD